MRPTPYIVHRSAPSTAQGPVKSADLTHTEYLGRTRMPLLDGIRAISILLTITVHAHIGQWSWLAGERGVTMFFILSGYLITFLALREERENGRLNLSAFYVRRTFRIFPLYYITVAIYAVLIYGLQVRSDKAANFSGALPYLLTYLQEIPFFFGVNGATSNIPLFHSWSLGIEEKFYLVWPVLIFVCLRTLRAWRLPACMAMIAIFACAPHFGRFGMLLFPYFHILVGCAVAIVLNEARYFAIARTLSSRLWLCAILLIFVTVQFISPLYTYWPFQQPIDVLYSLLGGVLLAALLTLESARVKILAHPALVFIGRLSYGIYLVHVLCLNVSEAALGKLSGFVSVLVLAPLNLMIAFALATAVALAFAITIERPLIRIGHRISGEILAGRPRPSIVAEKT
jgi:peptidoglycan/LPS O-acetylase OafA/YrhL